MVGLAFEHHLQPLEALNPGDDSDAQTLGIEDRSLFDV